MRIRSLSTTGAKLNGISGCNVEVGDGRLVVRHPRSNLWQQAFQSLRNFVRGDCIDKFDKCRVDYGQI